MASLHASDWDAMLRQLSGHGWEPVEDEDGLPVLLAMTGDGRECVALAETA